MIADENESDIHSLRTSFVKRIVGHGKAATGKSARKNPISDPSLQERIRRELFDKRDSIDGSPAEFAYNFLRTRATLENRQQKFLQERPHYGNTLWIFRPDNGVRNFCQRIVQTSYGIRSSGVYPRRKVLVLVLDICACVLYWLSSDDVYQHFFVL